MTYDIATVEVPDQSIVSIRERVVQSGVPAFIGRSFDALFGHLRLLRVTPSGEPFVLYHEFAATVVDAEVCVPVAVEVATTGAITSRVLPGTTVARTLHVGPYEDLGDAYGALTHWVGQQGLDVVGPVRERYLNAPGEDVPPSAYRTVIEMPVAKALVAVH